MKKPLILCIADALDKEARFCQDCYNDKSRTRSFNNEQGRLDLLSRWGMLLSLKTVCTNAHDMHEASVQEENDTKIKQMCDDVHDFIEKVCDHAAINRQQEEESGSKVRKYFVDNLRRLHAMLARRSQEAGECNKERSERVIEKAKHHAVTEILLGLYFLANDKNPPPITSATELTARKKERWEAYRNDQTCYMVVRNALARIMDAVQEAPEQHSSDLPAKDVRTEP